MVLHEKASVWFGLSVLGYCRKIEVDIETSCTVCSFITTHLHSVKVAPMNPTLFVFSFHLVHTSERDIYTLCAHDDGNCEM